MELKNRPLSRKEIVNSITKHVSKNVIYALLIYNLLLISLCLIVLQSQPRLKHMVLKKGEIVLRGALQAPIHYVINLFQFKKTPRINLDIKHKNFLKIAFKRHQALQAERLRGEFSPFLDKTDTDWVPAKIRFAGETLKAKIRLKGRMEDHWEKEDMWSLNVRMKGGKTLFGMKDFTLQHPKTRDYLNEWLLHKLLNHLGLISLRYGYVDVSINGKKAKLYALEEGIEKRLLEHNRRREGPIIKYDMDPYWSWGGRGINDIDFIDAHIQVYKKNRTLNNPVLLEQYQQAKNLLESFRLGKLSTSEVFDLHQLSRFLALIEIMGHHHAPSPLNLRLYYNPVTSRLEPIGVDNQHVIPVSRTGLQGARRQIKEKAPHIPTDSPGYYDLLFKDKLFYESYIQNLEKISKEKFLDDFFNSIGKDFRMTASLLRSRYFTFHPSASEIKKILYGNQTYIRDLLTTQQKHIQAYFKRFDDKNKTLTLVVHNSFRLPIELLGVTIDAIESKDLSTTLLQPKMKPHLPTYRLIKVRFPQNFQWSKDFLTKLKIRFHILGGSKVFANTIYPWDYANFNFIDSDLLRKSPNFRQFPFFKVHKKTKIIEFKPGRWKIDKNLILPEGYRIVSKGGLVLDLTKGAKVLSYSPLRLLGTAQSPIEIKSSDGSGEGLVVLNAKDKSLLSHTYFIGLKNPKEKGWGITGSITFYESPVTFTYCQFKKNKSEDALNIIRGDFRIEKCIFDSTQSDAFDGDFVNGTIVDTVFLNSGNDAIDISGANITINLVTIDGVGDKGLSAGERTELMADQVDILNANIAVASKDSSVLTLKNSNISDSKLAYTVYQKKSEFGPGTLSIENTSLQSISQYHLIEKGSEVTIDGIKINAEEVNVKDKLYGVEFGKSSR
ncbi:hypothetical protein BVX98_04200 [bacterium F11]|nr:hypothetical protein BVX98_04200 [bacterium F11]